jgi:glycine/serine hydroxymethyltransferase
MKEGEMKDIGRYIADAVKNITDENMLKSIRKEVCDLSKGFQLY